MCILVRGRSGGEGQRGYHFLHALAVLALATPLFLKVGKICQLRSRGRFNVNRRGPDTVAFSVCRAHYSACHVAADVCWRYADGAIRNSLVFRTGSSRQKLSPRFLLGRCNRRMDRSGSRAERWRMSRFPMSPMSARATPTELYVPSSGVPRVPNGLRAVLASSVQPAKRAGGGLFACTREMCYFRSVCF